MCRAKYQEWLDEDKLLLLAAWARDGLTYAQIAKNVGCAVKTLQEWRDKYPPICDALKKGREVCDIEVENALHKKALGYTVEVNKAFKVKRVDYDEMTGKKLREVEEIVHAIDEIHIPADTVAQIFWLKNRKPEQWRDKPVEATVDHSVTVTFGDELEGLAE